MDDAKEIENKVKTCLGNLYVSKPEARREVIAELERLGAPAVPGLVRALCGKPDWNMQARLNGLDTFDRKRRIDDLQWEVKDALIAIGEPAVAPLAQVLKKNKQERTRVIEILKAINSPAHPAVMALLKHRDFDVRLAAAEVLRASPTNETNVALRAMFYESTREMRFIRGPKRRAMLVCLLVGTWWASDYIVHGRLPNLSIFLQTFLWLVGTSSIAKSYRKKVVEDAMASADVTMLGGFIACLADNSDIRKPAMQSLLRLLPQVQASDRRYISDAEMTLLLKQLEGKEYPLILAILKALEQIGDEKALSTVEHLACVSAVHPDNVVEAAQECLPFLQQRVEQSRQANTLLRASEATYTPEVLLRAASAETATDPAQLLRPNR